MTKKELTKQIPPKEIDRIRSFIYINEEKLTSFFSQLEKGYLESIVEHENKKEIDKSSQKSKFLSGSEMIGLVEEGTSTIKHKVLHDHLYNLFEEKIFNSILNLDVESQEIDCTKNNLCSKPFIKVKGKAFVEDFNSLYNFIQQFNKFGLALTYLQNGEMAQLVHSLPIQMKLLDGKEKQKLQNISKQYNKERFDSYIKIQSMESNLYHDPEMLNGINHVIDLFLNKPTKFSIKKQNELDNESISFSSILDERWVKFDESLGLSFQAGLHSITWTMVGQIIYIPTDEDIQQIKEIFSGKNKDITSIDDDNISVLKKMGTDSNTLQSEHLDDSSSQVDEKSDNTDVKSKPNSISGAFRGLVNQKNNIIKLMTLSGNREVLISPLAIYHEIEVL